MNKGLIVLAAAVLAATTFTTMRAQAPSLTYETKSELFAVGDFDGNGKPDVVLVDRATGKYRLGYQTGEGVYTWVNQRPSGIKGISSLALGRVADASHDSVVFAAADANQVALVDAAKPGQAIEPVVIEFSLLGPSTAAVVDVGGAGNTPLQDLAVVSVYNTPEPNMLTLLRSTAGALSPLGDVAIDDPVAHPGRVTTAGGRQLVVWVATGSGQDTLRIEDFSGGKLETLATAGNLPAGADYTIGYFGGRALPEIVVYKPGDTNAPGDTKIHAFALEESGGKFSLGAPATFDLGQPLKLVVAAPQPKGAQLVALHSDGKAGAIYGFDGKTKPVEVQPLVPKPDYLLTGGAALDKQFYVFAAPSYGKYSSHYYLYEFSGATNAMLTYGALPSLADNDDSTVPEIHKRLIAGQGNLTAADMKAYTNAIPGSKVSYVMLPIPGGEFTLGSSDGEEGRNADEGPQQKIKISPFWMGQFEVGWNQYELFMFPDDEKKLRADNPTDEVVNKVSDAVTRPSKPYMEMSFGMGKDGYPAISMTQHAANKFCHWLSAKTGHFYRLPTEAEWEYACRAGTTTAYSFGDDPSKLGDYAVFEENSDFKYGKVGRKKPNPWGLRDMHGNVAEWCLDQYEPNYEKFVGSLASDPWVKSTTPYPHVVRGGSFDDPPAKLRSAARRGSSKDWKMRDPQLPKSIWWLTDAQFVGFRLVRPLQVPSPEELKKCWTSGVEKD